ncbi:MAG TPA: tRNA (guanosine(46)-N7)-methyltransferase TrmB [Gemmataceae bacterium]|nr:tRNA (guanosine(46)-N7)-methyltransferase TrmB [Gemmataceae bacterium]
MRRSSRLPPEELAPYLLNLPDPPTPFNWPAVFGADRPVEIEIGFGKGLFLLTAAQARPDVSFVGVEIVRKYQLFTATRLAKRGLPNVRAACGDGLAFLRDRVTAASLQALHVYFPDPWWKKRHHKRRLFTPEFAVQCGRVLRPGGKLHFVSDVEDYFHTAVGLLAMQPTLQSSPAPAPDAPRHDMDYLTNFERKFRKEGRPIFRACYEGSLTATQSVG